VGVSKIKRRKISLTGVADALAIGLLVATLFGFLGRFHWFFDLFSHFRVQYMQLCLPLIGIYLWKRLNKQAVALVLLAAVNYAFVLPLYFGKPEPAQSKPVRAMLMNINSGNGNTDKVLAAIRQADPDILLLEEVTPKWAADLTVLRSAYPYRVAEPQEGCFGIMLLSKHPLKNSEVLNIGNAAVPSIVTDIYLPDGEISFIGTHPVPPVGKDYFQERNSQLMELPYLAADQKHPVLLLGDFNTTPFSYWFKRVTETGLKNSMQGFGFQPTWPVQLPWPRIPIDHALHSEQIVIHNRTVGGDIGSDHLPVIVDFSVNTM
jgi:endonuclease/exonuclease/phosphatase (EEP) superfamily protein YafD